MRNYLIEIALLAVLFVLAGSIVNPYYMPMGIHLTVLALLVACFALFAALVWKERGGDEREIAIRHQIDRFAFLAGASVLIVGLVAQSLTTHMVDGWVLGALAAMVIAKICASMYHNW